MLAHRSKLRVLSLLLLVSWAVPLLLASSHWLAAAKAPAVHGAVYGDSIRAGIATMKQAKQVAASTPCRKCPNGKTDGSLQCSGAMLAIQVTVSHVSLDGLMLFLMPLDRNAERRAVAPDPPPPRLV